EWVSLCRSSLRPHQAKGQDNVFVPDGAVVNRWKCIWLALLFGSLAGCAEALDWAGDGVAAKTVYVFSNGWHSDIIVKRADLPPDKIPESGDFADKRFIVFGWGDRDYYTSPKPGLWITL